MKLYGGALSPFFRKARVVLEEKGIPYQIQPLVPVPKTPELLAMHPMGKIPILRDGDVVVPDSSVICAYLERKHPSPALYPQDAADLAAALFFEEYADTRMSEIIGGITRLLEDLRAHERLERDAPDDLVHPRVGVLLEEQRRGEIGGVLGIERGGGVLALEIGADH